MPGPFEATGAQKGATRFGALGMGARQFTGLVTQRSPYRDGAVPYLVGKFYGGSRFDSIWDGINREITQRLTDGRAPGSSVYSAGETYPAGNSFYNWKFIQKGVEKIRVVYDGQDGVIYDATAGQKSTLFTKNVAAGKARFCGVNTELFFGDGQETKKILRSAKVWQQDTTFQVGDFIIDSNGNIQSIQANPLSFSVTSTEVIDDPNYGFVLVVTLSAPAPVIPANQTASFSGMTGAPFLNGVSLLWHGLPDSTLALLDLGPDQIAFPTSHSAYGPMADTGQMIALTDEDGVTGLVEPIWGTTWGDVTNDNGFNGGVNWTCFGNPAQNWGLAGVPSGPAPSYMGKYPAVSGTGSAVSYWAPGTLVDPAGRAILDLNGNIQVPGAGGVTGDSGLVVPAWATVIGGVTIDGTAAWTCYGAIAPWYATTDYGGSGSGVANPCVILDTNGNLQGVSDVTTAAASGAGPVTWNTTLGGTTTDGAITWIMLGAGTVLWSGILQYAWSPVGIDGSVGTASPITLVANGGLGVNGGFALLLGVDITGTSAQTDEQVSRIKLWRTAQGQATLIELDEIPNPWLKGDTSVLYYDVSSDLELNAFIPAPVASVNNPPPPNLTAPVYYQQRIWGIVDNMVVHSGGPDTITGNGNTAFAPLDEIPFLAQPIKLVPVLVQNGGLIVMTTSGIKIILGTGTASNLYYVGDYLELVSVLSYDAVTVFYNQIFCMESNGKVSSIAIEYPFNPQSGYTEVGFPIGDQFVKVTTGGQNAALFTPSTAMVSWNANSSADTGMYVSSGTGFWFQMSLINPPESGILWNPLRELQGGASAVQSVETSPGVHNLLIAPAAGTTGPILMRDTTRTVWTDLVAGTPTPYPGWDAKGVTLLASTGQWASIKHVSAKSKNTGGPRPKVSVLFNEIEPSAQRPYIDMVADAGKSNDPSRSRASLSVYSDRYRLAQQGQETTGDCILVKFDYGAEAFGDELLDWAMYGAVHEEDEEQVAKA